MTNNTKPKELELPDNYPVKGATLPVETEDKQFTKTMPPIFELRALKETAKNQIKQQCDAKLIGHIKTIEKERNSKVIVYHSKNMIDEEEVMSIYQLFAGNRQIDNLDLLLYSGGGIADDAFKLYKLCRQHVKVKFSVLIPYKAKSAATLVAIGADELVMGPASEIGPVDPMIFVRLADGNVHLVPAHSIKTGLQFFEDRVKERPENALLYAQLTDGLDPTVIGAYQRAIESAYQYAETLLGEGLLKNNKSKISDTAKALSEKYKSHAFVIDRLIGREQYGMNIVDANETIWNSMWNIYNVMDFILSEDQNIGSIVKTSNSEIIISRKHLQISKANYGQ